MFLSKTFFRYALYCISTLSLLWPYNSFSAPANKSINVPVVMMMSLNGEASGGRNFNRVLGPSKFSKEKHPNALKKMGSLNKDYEINGAIYTNCPAQMCNGSSGIIVEVQPTRVIMQNGGSEIAVELGGNVGKRPIKMQGQGVDLQNMGIVPTLPWQADIQIYGDIDESSLSSDDRPGAYFGSFTIRASKY